MAAKGVIAPRLPAAPVEYDRLYIDTMLGILRQYFDQLDNAGPVLVSTQRKPAQGSVPASVISAISCAQPNPTSPAVYVISLPDQTDFALLRAGDIYYDTTAGNVLKIKV